MDKIVFESNNFVNIIFLFTLYPLYTNQGIWKSEIVCYFCFSDFSKVVIFLLSIIFLVFLELIGNLTHLALRYHKKGKYFVEGNNFILAKMSTESISTFLAVAVLAEPVIKLTKIGLHFFYLTSFLYLKQLVDVTSRATASHQIDYWI